MVEHKDPRLGKWPFFFADVVLLGTAATLVALGQRPLELWPMLAVVGCAGLGAWLAVLPYLKEYDGALKLAETGRLADTAARIGQLEDVADRIAAATSQWQAVHESARSTAETARGIAEKLGRDSRELAATVARTSDEEKQNLRLEVDKLRRGEGDWLQAVSRVMDHVFALHVAAVRSGQPAVVQQIEKFHAACRDALRRVGFSTQVAAPDERFDPRRHQCIDGAAPGPDARVDETVAPGLIYQGQMLRPIIVRVLREPATPPSPGAPVPQAPAGSPAAETGITLSQTMSPEVRET